MEFMDGSLVITLFRHGMTEANRKKAYLGWSDSPLVSAQSIVPIVPPCDIIVTSDLGRCIETSKKLFPNEPLVLMREWREMNFGEWEGCTYEQLKNHQSYRKWLDHWQTLSPPNGESYSEFSQRLNRAWDSLVAEALEKSISTMAIVTHGGVIRHILHTKVKNKKAFWDWEIPYNGGYQIDVKWKGGEIICTLLQEEPITERENG